MRKVNESERIKIQLKKEIVEKFPFNHKPAFFHSAFDQSENEL